jgi:predicted NBD/HSP70 family sugar kinase
MGQIAELEVAAGRSSELAALKRHLGGRSLTAAHVAEAAVGGDETAIAIHLRARNAVAAAVSGYVNVFNPSVVVLGGSIALAGGLAYLEAVRSAVDASSFPTAARRVSIVLARLGGDAGLLGAVPIVMQRLGSGPDGGLSPRQGDDFPLA